jgi:hypothetical protein
MSFADVEDRATASAMARVTNATVSFDAGATSVPAIFDNGAAAVMNGLAQSAQPSMYILASDFGSHKQGDAMHRDAARRIHPLQTARPAA